MRGDPDMLPIEQPRTSDTPEPADSHPALDTLLLALRRQGFVADLVSEDRLRVSSPHRPRTEVDLRCAPRVADGGCLWFFGDKGRPLSETTDITGAIVALKRTAVRMRPHRGGQETITVVSSEA
jgi:hypothetical protein